MHYNGYHVIKIIKDFYTQLYANKLDKLEEIDRCLKTHHTPGLSHKGMENLNKIKLLGRWSQ